MSTPPPPPVPPAPPEEVDFCCGKKGRLITYPVTTDPLQPPSVYEAPRDPAVDAVQVLLHNGAFFTNQVDLDVPALALDILWSKHFRGDVSYQDGGLMGHGWDFAYNKRLVPIAARKLASGLFAEQAGIEKAAFWYYNGQGRGERYVERDSDERDVLNFDAQFRAYVTTYLSPPGQFHEFERYILLPGRPHPFGEHPDVERTERIFYVMREKNGTRYVFNCRGQLIYILSRNDSRALKVRVTLHYGGPINPLTQNRMLTRIEDATGRKYFVETVAINQGAYATNYDCKPANGVESINRIARIVGAGLVVSYQYRSGSDPTLVATTIAAAGAQDRRWEYEYDGNHQMTAYRDPNNCARGRTGAPTLANAYSGTRVTSQQLGGLARFTITGASVTDGAGTRIEATLGDAGGFPVVTERVVHPADGRHGGPWRTRFAHNADTQVTAVVLPGGGSTQFEYEGSNAPVTLGPIRDKPGVTYESNLARGNLLAVTLVPNGRGGPALTSRQTYEPLYNQLLASTDAAGNVTRYAYDDYFAPRHRGNPSSVQFPPVAQPGGGSLDRTTNRYAYNAVGQRVVSDVGDGGVTGYEFDGDGQLVGIRYPGGGFERFTRTPLGHVTRHETQAGATDYERDGFGLLRTRIVDPDTLHVRTDYRYDANGNELEVATTVRDHLEGAPALEAFAAEPEYRRTLQREYDDMGRITLESISGGGLSSDSRYRYGRDGRLERVEAPSLAGGEPHVTTIEHDARGLVVRTVEADGTRVAKTGKRTYDDDGHMVSAEAIQASVSGRERRLRTTYDYDGLGRLVSWTDPAGATTRVEHDARGNVVRLGMFAGPIELRRIRYAYDAYGNLIERSADSLAGAVETSQWHYSPHLRLVRITSPNGGETTLEYDAANRATRVVDPLGNVTENEYSFSGRLVAITQRAPERRVDPASGRLVETAKARVTRIRHDTLGRAVSVRSGDRIEFSVYDSLGRVRAAKSPTGQVSTIRYDRLGRRVHVTGPLMDQRFSYTPGGLVSEVRGPDGRRAFRYDASGRTIESRDLDTGAVTVLSYDGDDVIEVDPNGTRIVTTVNAAGQPLRIVATPSGRTIRGGFTVVGGPYVHEYGYDGLGRLVHARTDRGSEVALERDALDRPVEERQTYAGLTHTVARSYAPDWRWSETVYPRLADSLRVRRHADLLGRVERVEANGRDVARYAWSGIDRLAARFAGNGTQTRFAYDADDRLALVQLVRAEPGRGAAGRVLWAQRAQYDDDGPLEVTDTRFAQGAAGDAVTRTSFLRDGFGRVTMASTTASVVAGPGGATVDETSVTTHAFDGARLVETVTVDGVVGGLARSVRVDRLAHDAANRVQLTVTEGGFDARVPSPAAVSPASAIASARASARGEQRFAYDANGNLVDDGRFLYAYDFRNRLVRVEDTRAPYGYREAVRFDYDALGRRVAIHRERNIDPAPGLVDWSPPWIGGMTWLLYDGEHVIAEAVRNHPKAGPLPRFSARYVHGARADEIVRVERRPEADPGQEFRTFYVHEDLNGSIRELSGMDGRLHPVRQADAHPGQPLGERPPGDAVMAGATGVRMPYVGGRTRIDSFASIAYRDDLGAPVHDFRRAPAFHIAAGRDIFRASISADQARGLVALGAITAGAFAPTLYGIAAPALALSGQQSALGYAASALAGGSLSLGATFGMSLYTGDSLTRSEALAAFAQGALFGMGGSFVNGLGMGLVRSLGADIAASLVIGTTLGVASGDGLAQAFNDNAAGALMDGGLGFAAGTFGAGVRSVAGQLARRGASLAPQAPTNAPAVARAGPAEVAAQPALAQTATARLARVEPDPPGFVLSRSVQWTPELRLLAHDIMTNLDQGTAVSAEIARRIRQGELSVRLYAGSRIAGDSGALGYWSPFDPARIHINIDHAARLPSGRYASPGIASTVVHEGIHALGGGEISSHVGQAIFLHRTFKRQILAVPRGVDLDTGHLPTLHPAHIDLLNVVRTNNMARVYDFVAYIKNYGLPDVRNHFFVTADPWILQQGGWARALNVRDPLYDTMEATWLKYRGDAARAAVGIRLGMF